MEYYKEGSIGLPWIEIRPQEKGCVGTRKAELGKVISSIERVKIWAKKDFKPNEVGL